MKLLIDILDIPYSLGDVIDWKRGDRLSKIIRMASPYSLGDVIDWKLVLATL